MAIPANRCGVPGQSRCMEGQSIQIRRHVKPQLNHGLLPLIRADKEQAGGLAGEMAGHAAGTWNHERDGPFIPPHGASAASRNRQRRLSPAVDRGDS